MATATIYSALLSSDDPHRLRDWYAYVFEASVERTPGDPGYDVVDLDGYYLMIDARDDVSGATVEPTRHIVNADVDDPHATGSRIDERGFGWHSPLEQRDDGWFGCAIDPDGNLVQIISLSEEMEREAQEASMKPFSGFAVRDIDEAAEFYRTVMGLRVDRNEMGILTLHLDRRSRVLIYPKDDHEPAGFTVLNFPVSDIDVAVDELVAKGVTMLRYDALPSDDRGVMRGREQSMGPDIAWFADPSGNVLSVMH